MAFYAPAVGCMSAAIIRSSERLGGVYISAVANVYNPSSHKSRPLSAN